jgi:hypothetical protein
MKMANPLYYPLAIACGGFILVIGVRLFNLPFVVTFPVAAAIATAGAAVLKRNEPESLGIDDPELEAELMSVKQQAQALAHQAQALSAESMKLLTEADQMDLLTAVSYACDRASEFPSKIDLLIKKFKGGEALLSLPDLELQLNKVKQKLASSAGVAQSQLQTLAAGLERNIELVRHGDSAKQAQVASLATLVVDASGALQELQNKLRIVNLNDLQQTAELRSLADELNSFQENAEFLLGK